MKAKSKTKAKSKSRVKAAGNARSRAKAKTRTASKPNKLARPANRLRDLADWRQQVLDRVRALILEADPAMVEERKWRKPTNPAGVPVFSHDGIVCTGESYKNAVKLTFMHGARLADPARLFNAGLDGAARRAIDIKEGETIDPAAFKALIQAAVAHNAALKK